MTHPYYKWEQIQVFETSIDDMNPEFYPYLMDKLLSQGALDVYLQPIMMKKGRPGVLLTVLAPLKQEQALLQTIFTETTTLGVRIREEKRAFLARSIILVDTDYGPVRVKVSFTDNPKLPHCYQPEYEDCKARAQATGAPIADVFRAATWAAEKFWEQHRQIK